MSVDFPIHVLFLWMLIFTDALKDTLDLQLVGPFDILAGAHKSAKNPEPNFHLHWRYYYDPPEFQTILKGSEDSQYHMGYYRYSRYTFCNIKSVKVVN